MSTPFLWIFYPPHKNITPPQKYIKGDKRLSLLTIYLATPIPDRVSALESFFAAKYPAITKNSSTPDEVSKYLKYIF